MAPILTQVTVAGSYPAAVLIMRTGRRVGRVTSCAPVLGRMLPTSRSAGLRSGDGQMAERRRVGDRRSGLRTFQSGWWSRGVARWWLEHAVSASATQRVVLMPVTGFSTSSRACNVRAFPKATNRLLAPDADLCERSGMLTLAAVWFVACCYVSFHTIKAAQIVSQRQHASFCHCVSNCDCNVAGVMEWQTYRT